MKNKPAFIIVCAALSAFLCAGCAAARNAQGTVVSAVASSAVSAPRPTAAPTPAPEPTPAPVPEPESISLPGTLVIGAGEAVFAGPAVEPAGVPASAFAWASSDENVVTVDADGVLTGVSEGEATVTAEAGDLSASMKVQVTRGPYAPLSEIVPARYTLSADGVYTSSESDGSGSAVLMLTGDWMCLSAQQSAAASGETYDFRGSFARIKNLFAQADLVCGNLETLTAHSAPYTYELKTFDSGDPNCNAPATYLDALREAGADAFVTANNHCGDGGVTGVQETLRMLDKYGLAHTGTSADTDAPRFALFDVNGVRIALLGYTEARNSNSLFYGDNTRMVNLWSEEAFLADESAARAAGAELVIVYEHWGVENDPAPSEKQRAHAQFMADNGADLIAGSHPHCIQPAEILAGPDGKEVPCLYSMGNFISSMSSAANNDTAILRVTAQKTASGAEITGWSFIPAQTVHSGAAGFQVVPVSADSAAGQRIAAVLGSAVSPESGL